MTSPSPNEINLHADQEHAGLRAVVLLIVFGGFVAGFVILNPILGNGEGIVATYALPISCVVALVLSVAGATIAEMLMKRHWPSGRRLVINDQHLKAWLPGGETATLDWSGRVWTIKWTYSLVGYPLGGRERRLTKGHHCLSCQLQQDDVRVIVYAYLRGQQAATFLEENDFHRLNPAAYYERGPMRWLRGASERPTLPNGVLTGRDGPFWLAEQRRWSDGIELTSEDFVTFWDNVRDRVEA